MAVIKIDGRQLESLEGETLLSVARRSGISIPALCFREGMEHFSSCMVCMVRDMRSGAFIPSCSAQVRDGMEIDASSDEVIRLRKKSVELLLSEHRAECEAPCHVVCPAGYDIPVMNRLLIDGNIKAAIELAIAETGNKVLHCFECKAYCENACRRKKIDQPVSIRNIKIFVYNNSGITPAESSGSEPLTEKKKIFSSRIGRLDDEELKEWIRESVTDTPRFREISDFRMAGAEAGSCMHCDCRASSDCRLRDLAQELGLKDPTGKVINSPVQKKINYQTGLIFENAKCIKCGLCVRVCEDSTTEPALCFLHRGFVSVISEPIGMEFDDILATQAEKCIEVCPTGALGQYRQIK
jgi:ferredoxin